MEDNEKMIDKEDFDFAVDIVLAYDDWKNLFTKYPEYKIMIAAVLQDISERLFD